MNGIFGNSEKNSNGTDHHGGMFSKNKLFPEFQEISEPFVHITSARLLTVILPRKNAKDLKDGGRFPKSLSLQCVSLLVGGVGGREKEF